MCPHKRHSLTAGLSYLSATVAHDLSTVINMYDLALGDLWHSPASLTRVLLNLYRAELSNVTLGHPGLTYILFLTFGHSDTQP